MTTSWWHHAARAAAAVGLVVALSTGSAVHAVDPTPPAATPSPTTTYDKVPDKFSLTVSPTRIAVDQKHNGEQQTLLVVNRGLAALTITTEKRDFTGGVDGTLVFDQNAPYSASSWVTIEPARFTLASGASRTVTATIHVPASPEPGDHQVAFVFLVPSASAAGNIRINRGIGVPMYVTVPGPIDRSVVLSNLSAPGFAEGGTITTSATLHNIGTVHRDFRGTTPLVQAEGGTSTRFPDFTVIRGATRNVSTTWNAPLMCICHVTVAIANPDGAPQSTTVRVIVFPVRIAALILVGLTAVIVLALWRRRRSARVEAASGHLTEQR